MIASNRRYPKPAFIFLLLLFAMALIMVLFVSYKTNKIADDVWKQLGLSATDGNRDIINSFINGHLYYTGAKNAKNITLGNRVAVVRELAAYAKKYVNSEAFQHEYEAYRDKKKPAAPVYPQITPEMIRAEEKIRIENQLKSLEANVNSPNEKLRNSIPARTAQLKKELSDLDNPDNKTVKMRMDNAAKSKEWGQKQYNDALVKYAAQYPETPLPLIKKRLEELLAATTDVDFNAELKDINGKKIFVNPAYQSRSNDWKLAYRAGKETTEAVRMIAQQWLQEIK